MRAVLTLLSALVALALQLSPVCAEKRVALVVGNNSYSNLPDAQQLKTAINDAHAVGDTLTRLGFEVIRGENLDRSQFSARLDELTRRLQPGDTAAFYFAGHGVSLGGGNYLLPSDVPEVEMGQESLLARASIGEDDIVGDIQARGARVVLVVLDACRDNPFKQDGKRSVGGARGLTRMEAARGVFKLYSAGIGQTALDRLSRSDTNPNSVFTRVLVPELVKPGRDLTGLARDVGREVLRLAASVGHEQQPAYYDQILDSVYLAGPPPEKNVAASAGGGEVREAERAWAATKDTTDPVVLKEFIRRYSSDYFAVLAQARLKELAAAKAEPAKAEPAKSESAKPDSPKTAAGSAKTEEPGRLREESKQKPGDATVLSDARAVSFDCSKAGTTVEQTICSDKGLMYLDGVLNKNYRAIMMDAAIGSAGKQSVTSDQRSWISERNQCAGDRNCIMTGYLVRLDQLCHGAREGEEANCTDSKEAEKNLISRDAPDAASVAGGMDCAKASKPLEKKICAAFSLRVADAAMGEAYGTLLKAAPDTEIRAILVRSQRRWIEARDKFYKDDKSGAVVEELRRQMWNRTVRLKFQSKDGFGYIVNAQALRRFITKYAGGAFSGFVVDCSFVPEDRSEHPHYTYTCSGTIQVENNGRICGRDRSWASWRIYDKYAVFTVTNGKAVPFAYCDSSRDCFQGAQWSSPDAVKAGGLGNDWIAAPGVSKLEADIGLESDEEIAWFDRCLTSPKYAPTLTR